MTIDNPLLEIASSHCLLRRLRTAPAVAYEEQDYSMDLRIAKWGPMPRCIAVFLNCRCQLWVKNGSGTLEMRLPLSPYERTSPATAGMSASQRATRRPTWDF